MNRSCHSADLGRGRSADPIIQPGYSYQDVIADLDELERALWLRAKPDTWRRWESALLALEQDPDAALP
jgi:hypothetical protein